MRSIYYSSYDAINNGRNNGIFHNKRCTEDKDIGMYFRNCVVTNGCFDVIHPGHLKLLNLLNEVAVKFSLKPIIFLNSDESIKKIKGESRPIVPETARSKILTSLEHPFDVVMFDEENPQFLMDLLKPTFVIKGSDYLKKDVISYRDSHIIICKNLKDSSDDRNDDWSTTKILLKK